MVKKCTDTCVVTKDWYGDLYCFQHGTVSTSYRAGDALDLADMGRHVKYNIPESQVIGLFNYFPRFTMIEMAKELGCSTDVLQRMHKKMGLSYGSREGNTHAGMSVLRR